MHFDPRLLKGSMTIPGPEKSLYIPRPLLQVGENKIIVFENYLGSSVMKFPDIPKYGTTVTYVYVHAHNKDDVFYYC